MSLAATAYLIYRKDTNGNLVYRATRLTLEEATKYKLKQSKSERGLYEIVAYQVRPQWHLSANDL